MLEHTSESDDVLLSIVETTCDKEKTTDRDKDVATPASRPVNGKMRQASGKARDLLGGPQRRRLYVASLLDTDHSQLVNEFLTMAHIITEQVNTTLPSSIVSNLHDDCKVP